MAPKSDTPTLGKVTFSAMPGGPRKFENRDRRGNVTGASVQAFVARVAYGALTLIGTAYGRTDKDTGEIVFSVSLPGRGGAGSRPVIEASDDFANQFADHVETAALEWPAYAETVSAAAAVLLAKPGDKPSNGAARGQRLRWTPPTVNVAQDANAAAIAAAKQPAANLPKV